MMDLMIDLETLGTLPDAPVISIGASFFDIEAKALGPTFYVVLDIDSQLEKGRVPSGPTIKWWVSQSSAAKKVFQETSHPTKEGLKAFCDWYLLNCGADKAFVWGNGAPFDISMLENLLRHYDLDIPWGHRNIMDLRTFRRFNKNGTPVKNNGVEHNALDDAIAQAEYVLGLS